MDLGHAVFTTIVIVLCALIQTTEHPYCSRTLGLDRGARTGIRHRTTGHMVILKRAGWERMEKPRDNKDLGGISMHSFRGCTVPLGSGLGMHG